MALVFALRLTCVGLVILGATLALTALGVTSDREFEALALLFSVFFLTVTGVLLFLRFSSHLYRLMLLTPSLALVMPAWSWQLLSLWVGGMFVLEAFRAQAQVFHRPSFFALSELLWLVLGLLAMILYPPYLLWVCGILAISLGVTFGLGCWRWQQAIKEVMFGLDLD